MHIKAVCPTGLTLFVYVCPLGETVRLGLVRRHCYVSKLS